MRIASLPGKSRPRTRNMTKVLCALLIVPLVGLVLSSHIAADTIVYEYSGTLHHQSFSDPDVAGFDGLDFYLRAEHDANATRDFTNNVNSDLFYPNSLTLTIDPGGANRSLSGIGQQYVQWVTTQNTDHLHFSPFEVDIAEDYWVNTGGIQFPSGTYGPISSTNTLPPFDPQDVLSFFTFNVTNSSGHISTYSMQNPYARGYVVPEPSAFAFAGIGIASCIFLRRRKRAR